MVILLLVVLALFFLGWCSGSRTEKPRCDCERCWYVGEPPVSAPLFCFAPLSGARNLAFWAVAGVSMLFWLLRRPGKVK